MRTVQEIEDFKAFKKQYFDFKEFLIRGNKEKLQSFYDECVKLNFIKPVEKVEFPMTIIDSRIIHFGLLDE